MDVTLSGEDAQLHAKNNKPWPPGIVEQLDLNPYDKDLEWRTVIIVASNDEKGLAFNDVLVHDGEAELWVAREWLR